MKTPTLSRIFALALCVSFPTFPAVLVAQEAPTGQPPTPKPDPAAAAAAASLKSEESAKTATAAARLSAKSAKDATKAADLSTTAAEAAKKAALESKASAEKSKSSATAAGASAKETRGVLDDAKKAAAEIEKAREDAATSGRRERTIYLPFAELEKVFEKEGRGVFLPYREFVTLWDQVKLPKKADARKPPVEGILSGAVYDGKVDDETATLGATLEFESFKEKGWAVLPFSSAAMNIAEADTGKAVLEAVKEGRRILLPEKGKYTVTMKVYAKVTRSNGRNSVALTLPNAAVSRLSLLVPGSGWKFEIGQGSAFTTKPAGESTRLDVFAGGVAKLDISWRKEGEETGLTPLVFAQADATSTVAPGAFTTSLNVSYRILRAGVKEFSMQIPKPHSVLSAEGENIRDWKIEERADGEFLTVSLHTPARKQYRLQVNLEAGIASLPADMKLPAVEISGVERQSGQVVVRASNELEVKIGATAGLVQRSGMQRAGKKAAPDALATLGAWRYLRRPFSMALGVKQAEPEVEVKSFTRLTVDPQELRLRADFTYDVRRAGIFETRIELPDGFEKAEAAGSGVDRSEVEKVGDKRVLVVRFQTRKLGTIAFQVTAKETRKSAEEPVKVPVFVPLNVERHEAQVGLAVHVSLDPNTTDYGGLEREDVAKLPLGKGELTHRLTPVKLGFRYRDNAKPATIAFKKRKPVVSADVLALAEVKEALVSHQWWIRYSIQSAEVDTFDIAVPAAIADDIRFDDPNIKERRKLTAEEAGGTAEKDAKDAKDAKAGGKDEAGDAETITWRVTLRDRKIGSYMLRATLEAPHPSLEPGGRKTIALPEIKPAGLFHETGQVAVTKDTNLEILKVEASGLEEIDPKELRSPLARDGVVTAYKYASHPAILQLEISKNLFLDVPRALVPYAVVNTVVASDLARSTEVIYWVRNNALQFFTVNLPANGRMLSDIYVDGNPQQPLRRANQEGLLIRLPDKQGGNKAIPIRFVYEVPSKKPGAKLGPTGSFKIEMPVLEGVEIIQSELNLYLPEDYRYVRFTGAMREPALKRRWASFRRKFDRLIPALGPAPRDLREKTRTESSKRWELTGAQSAGFDFQLPREGVVVGLKRFGAPAETKVVYRGKALAYAWDALCGLAAFVIGVLLTPRPLRQKFLYFAAAGLGALVVAGAVAPRSSWMWYAVFLGVMAAAVVWIVFSAIRFVNGLIRRIGRKIQTGPTGPTSPTPDQPEPAEPAKKPAKPESPEKPEPPAAPPFPKTKSETDKDKEDGE